MIFTFTPFSRRSVSKTTYSNSYIHGSGCHARPTSTSGFSILPKDNATCIPGESNQQASNNKSPALLPKPQLCYISNTKICNGGRIILQFNNQRRCLKWHQFKYSNGELSFSQLTCGTLSGSLASRTTVLTQRDKHDLVKANMTLCSLAFITFKTSYKHITSTYRCDCSREAGGCVGTCV